MLLEIQRPLAAARRTRYPFPRWKRDAHPPFPHTLPPVLCPHAFPRPTSRFFPLENKKKRQGLSRNFCVANLNDLCWFNLKQAGCIYIYIYVSRRGFVRGCLIFHAVLELSLITVYCILEKTFSLLIQFSPGHFSNAASFHFQVDNFITKIYLFNIIYNTI